MRPEIGSPYLEDTQVNGAVSIAGFSTCWTGVIPNTVNGTVKLNDNPGGGAGNPGACPTGHCPAPVLSL
jgi:hypothetical protein